MKNKTLTLILAAGRGTRVQSILKKGEHTKGMIEIGDSRLIDRAIANFDEIDVEIAVRSSSLEVYSTLNDRITGKGLRVLDESTRYRSLPTLLELPYILLHQYLFSKDSGYLKSFDSILTMPCDLVYNNVNFGDFLEFHNHRLKNSANRQLTILSKAKRGGGRADFFKMEGKRIMGMKVGGIGGGEAYEESTQAGVYVFSKGLLSNPLNALLGVRYNKVYRYLTNGDWVDYGDPKNVIKARGK